MVTQSGVLFYAAQVIRGNKGHNIGTLCIAGLQPRKFSDPDKSVLQTLAQLIEREVNLTDVIEIQSDLLETRKQLIQSQQLLAEEISEATNYVTSLLPHPLQGAIATDWIYRPSSELGGDAFGYQWLDDDHFAFYLIDVSGHGAGAALLSVSVLNTLNQRTLPDTQFTSPAQVLTSLNGVFQMEKHGNRFFTGWYGVYNRSKHTLRFASAGHPPQVLLSGSDVTSSEAVPLKNDGMVIGAVEDYPYEEVELKLAPWNRIYLFSDGVFELDKGDTTRWSLEKLQAWLQDHSPDQGFSPQHVLNHLEHLHAGRNFDDDVSLLQIDIVQ